MTRYVLSAAALLSPLLFPFPVTLLLSGMAALFFPPAALMAGLLTDLLYYTPTASVWPLATTAGLALSVAAFFLRRFFKARIVA